jgi:hypothetical protein
MNALHQPESLGRRERRELVRASLAYRVRRWRRSRVAKRIGMLAGYLASLLLLVSGGLVFLIYAAGPDSGLLPKPWPQVLGAVVGAAIFCGSLWLSLSEALRRGRSK